MLLRVLWQQNQNNQNIIKGIKGIKGFENISDTKFFIINMSWLLQTASQWLEIIFAGIIAYLLAKCQTKKVATTCLNKKGRSQTK